MSKITAASAADYLRQEVEMWLDSYDENGWSNEDFRMGFRAGILHGLWRAIHRIEQGAL